MGKGVGDGWWWLWWRLVTVLVEEMVAAVVVRGGGLPWVNGERRERDVLVFEFALLE